MRNRRALIVAVAALVAALVGCSDGDTVPSEEVVIAGTVQHAVRSEIMDRTFSVQVALPRNYDPTADAYPVLYMLDPSAHFPMVVNIVRALTLLPDERELPDLVVVGVGYDVAHFYDAIGVRTADLTPTRDTAYERMWTEEWPYLPPIGRPTGGGRDLLRFFTDELAPVIEAEYNLDPTDRALLGHSFGGLFTMFALLDQPGFFSRYLAVSPSLWWNCHPDTNRCWGNDGLPGVFFEREAEVRGAGTDLAGRLFVAMESGAQYPHMIVGARRLASVLVDQPYPSLQWTVQEYPGQTHQSVVPGAVSDGLRWLYAEASGS